MTHVHSLDRLLDHISDRSVNTTEVGSAVEDVADWALLMSGEYGSRIARIERWEDWAERVNLSVRNDIGIDRVVTTVTGAHWAVQVKGYDTKRRGNVKLLPGTRVGLDALGKLVAAAPLVPRCEHLIVVSTGGGFTRHARNTNMGASHGVHIRDRAWMRGTAVGDQITPQFPSSLERLKVGLDSARAQLRREHPAHY